MRLLDLFSGAGGCAVGYHQAGFTDIVGVDIEYQKRYPFHFVQGDALDVMEDLLDGRNVVDSEGGAWCLRDFDAVHASPPCQAYSKAQRIQGNEHPDLIGPTRELLIATGKPYVIENVPGAPLINPIILAGSMFGLLTMRERLFECSFPVPFRLIPPPARPHAKMGRLARRGEYVHVVGKGGVSGVKEQWEEAMGIDWMTITELSQAIPPAYTKFIGMHLLRHIETEREVAA